jgi:hypothetical protein
MQKVMRFGETLKKDVKIILGIYKILQRAIDLLDNEKINDGHKRRKISKLMREDFSNYIFGLFEDDPSLYSTDIFGKYLFQTGQKKKSPSEIFSADIEKKRIAKILEKEKSEGLDLAFKYDLESEVLSEEQIEYIKKLSSHLYENCKAILIALIHLDRLDIFDLRYDFKNKLVIGWLDYCLGPLMIRLIEVVNQVELPEVRHGKSELDYVGTVYHSIGFDFNRAEKLFSLFAVIVQDEVSVFLEDIADPKMVEDPLDATTAFIEYLIQDQIVHWKRTREIEFQGFFELSLEYLKIDQSLRNYSIICYSPASQIRDKRVIPQMELIDEVSSMIDDLALRLPIILLQETNPAGGLFLIEHLGIKHLHLEDFGRSVGENFFKAIIRDFCNGSGNSTLHSLGDYQKIVRYVNDSYESSIKKGVKKFFDRYNLGTLTIETAGKTEEIYDDERGKGKQRLRDTVYLFEPNFSIIFITKPNP